MADISRRLFFKKALGLVEGFREGDVITFGTLTYSVGDTVYARVRKVQNHTLTIESFTS
jgi:hypothetical protein